ncbi:tyrosine-type recombinase/integrase [Brevibacillus agri]|uniref:tyrosine-type recombinase/integrase n=1 Tax=Brevibacillus agri TaxID=51101 RepID=UPI0030F40B6D
MSEKRKGRATKLERFSVRSDYSLDLMFEKFYHAKVAEGRKERTLESYRENYKFFVDYLDLRGIGRDVRNVNSDLVRDYIVWMLNEKVKFEGHKFGPKTEQSVGITATSANIRIKTLKTMFKYLKQENIIENNPLESIKKITEDDNEIIVLTVEQLKALLKAPNQRRYAGFRDTVLMNLLIDGFLRINEALSLRRQDIDFEQRMVTIRAEEAKTRRSRTIPLQKHTMSLLEELLRENLEFDSDYVFLANYGERLTSNHFRHRLKEYAIKAGINRRVHPHLFRHTSATMALEAGMDVRHLQMMLGHRDLRMVMRYTHLSKTSLQIQHDRYSPLKEVVGKLEKERKLLR